MNNTNEKDSMMSKIKTKTAEMLANVLIRQADEGAKESIMLIISEPQFPIELMREDAY